MNAAIKILLVISVIGICNSFPQQGGNAPPGRPYRDTSSQVSPPGAGTLDGPQVEDLHSTRDIPKGSQNDQNTKDVPKESVRPTRQTKDVPKDQPETKDIPKLTQQSRVVRQAQTIPQPLSDPVPPQTRPAPPGSAGQPQVQPIRQTRQTKDVPKDQPAPSTRPGAPGPAGQPQVQPIRQTRQTKDVPKDQPAPSTRPGAPGPAGQPQVQPIRQARQTKDVPKDQPETKDIPKLTQQSRVARQAVPIPQPLPDSEQPQTRPALPGSAGQPQVQPIRQTRQTKDVPKDQPAPSTRPGAPGPAGQPQVQPIRPTRQTKDVPKDSLAAGTKDIPKEDTRLKRQVAQPIPQPLPGSANQPQTLPPRQTRQTKDVPKDSPAAGTKDIPKDSQEHRHRRDTDHAHDDAHPITLPAKVADQPQAGQLTKDIPKKQD